MTNKLNLMLHCGANVADREQVQAAETPEPTKSWHPIPHVSLIDMLRTRLPAYGMEIVQEAHGMWKDGARYFGMFQVAPKAIIGGDGTPDESAQDFGLVFGLRNSHDKTFPAGLALGSGVFVCDNLAFSAEIVIGRRHTTHIMRDLPLMVDNAVGKLVEARRSQANRLEVYKQTELTDKDASLLVMDALKAGAINTTRVPKVWKQWETPNHPEFADKTAWRLFNGFTEVYKETSLTDLSKRSTRLHGLLDAACGVVIDAKASVREAIEGMEDATIN